MEGHWFKFKNREIYLEEDEIFEVHLYYVIQQYADYLRENYPHLTEDKVMEMAWVWREKEMQENYSNEDALAELLEYYEIETKTYEDFDDSAAWDDGSLISCKDCPDDECTGHCTSCAYRPI